MADDPQYNPDGEAKRWFALALIGTVLYVGTVFVFVILADPGSNKAQAGLQNPQAGLQNPQAGLQNPQAGLQNPQAEVQEHGQSH